jgi:hypothetical protein
MPATTQPSRSLVVRRTAAPDEGSEEANQAKSGGRPGKGNAGFGKAPRQDSSQGKGRRRRGSGLSAADRSPLGKAPELEAIIARQRLGLPLTGRLREADVTRAWKLAAGDHHPDRGGRHDTMQAVNMARDLLLGRGVV